MKPVTGQYECVHSSGVGLDYFTSRIDRLTLHPNGRFSLATQDRSRLSNAAQSLISGQQVSTAAPETRREGNYTVQSAAPAAPGQPAAMTIVLRFDDGSQEQGKPSWNGEGIQFGTNFFNKVSESTLLPSTDRMKKDMDDIAKGVKIATTLGSFAVKAAKTINETIQATKGPGVGPTTPHQPVPGQPQPVPQAPRPAPPVQPAPVRSGPAPQTPPARPVQPPPAAQPAQTESPAIQPVAPGYTESLFCDQCGSRVRPGKRFCNNCGAPLQ